MTTPRRLGVFETYTTISEVVGLRQSPVENGCRPGDRPATCLRSRGVGQPFDAVPRWRALDLPKGPLMSVPEQPRHTMDDLFGPHECLTDECRATHERGEVEQRIARQLASFGWTFTEEFWQRYHSDAWVFNLTNALERLHRSTEGDPTSVYHEVARLRALVESKVEDSGSEQAQEPGDGHPASRWQHKEGGSPSPAVLMRETGTTFTLVATDVTYCVTHNATDHDGKKWTDCRFRQLFYFENPMDEHSVLWADEIAGDHA